MNPKESKRRAMSRVNYARYKVHHQAVQQHFNCGPEAYESLVRHDGYGIQLRIGPKGYRVETLAERSAICQRQLLTLEEAHKIDMGVAVNVLEGDEKDPDCFHWLLYVLLGSGEQDALTAHKANLALGLGIHQMGCQDLWPALGQLDASLIAAALVAHASHERGSGQGTFAYKIANEYFAQGAYALSRPLGFGLFVQLSVEGTNLALYEVDSSKGQA